MGNGQSVAAFNYAKRLLHFALINKRANKAKFAQLTQFCTCYLNPF